MCTYCKIDYRCGHKRRFWDYCSRAPTKDVIIITHLQTPPRSSSTPWPSSSRSATPIPTRNARTAVPASIFSSTGRHGHRRSPSIPLSLAPYFDPQNKSVERVLRRERHRCEKFTTYQTSDSKLVCWRSDCAFELMGRLWTCCKCGKGPNREPICVCGRKKGVACSHRVCEECAPYEYPPIPVYDPMIRDWTAKPRLSPRSSLGEVMLGKDMEGAVMMSVEDIGMQSV